MSKKKNYLLDLVKPSGALELHRKKNIADVELCDKISALGDIAELVYSPDVIELFCNLVENIECVTLDGPQKKELVIKHLVRVYPTTNSEKDLKLYSMWIDYICRNKSICRVPVDKIAKAFLKKSLSIVLKKE